MLAWIVQRVAGDGAALDTPIGRVPAPGAIDTTGLDIDAEALAKLVAVDADSWRRELPQLEDHYRGLGDQVPAELREQLTKLEKRLAAS